MADVYNYNNFQIDAVGLTGDLGGVGGQQNRAFDMRMSNFGALNFGTRSSSDYTRILFQDPEKVENPNVPRWPTDNERNPYTNINSVNARFRVKNDELTVMGIGNRRSNKSTDQPKFDVSDTYASVDDGTNVPKQFPMEGWHSFGGRIAGPENYVAPGHNPITA